MKLLKRASAIMAATMVLTGSLSCVYASETEDSSVETYDSSDEDYDSDAPVIEKTWTDTKDGKTYLYIQLTDATGVTHVRVDDSEAEYVSGDKTEPTYVYEVTKEAEYTIAAVDGSLNTRIVTEKVSLGTKNTDKEAVDKEVVDKETTDKDKSEETVKKDADQEAAKEVEKVVGSETATTSQVIKFQLGSKVWTKNDKAQEPMEAAPMLKGERVYLPVRYTAAALDLDNDSVKWDASSKTVTIDDGANVVRLVVDSKIMMVNAKPVEMDAAPIYEEGRVFLPVSQVGKAFEGVAADWDSVTKTVTITKTAQIAEQ